MFRTLTNGFRRMWTRKPRRPRRPGTGALRLEALEGRLVPAPVVPAYSSLPGAAASLYLDFDGHSENLWGQSANGEWYAAGTSPYNLEAGSNSWEEPFSSAEKAAIKEIWQRVAEDFAPFNINVTTVNPGDFSDGKGLRVAIGGYWSDWHWEGQPTRGDSYKGSFSNAHPNTVWVFQGPGQGQPRYDPRSVADAVAHEAGRAFGLDYQSLYLGTRFEEYNPGTSTKAPIMGWPYDAARSTWWKGPTPASATSIQDDMAVIAGAANGFGYRADDHGNAIGTATVLKPKTGSSTATAWGVIATTADKDYFSFTTGGGPVTLKVNVATVGANLDAKLELWRKTSFGQLVLVASADPSSSLGATISANLAAGTYYLAVGSHGSYGDVGQYTVTATFPPPLLTALSSSLTLSGRTGTTLQPAGQETTLLAAPALLPASQGPVGASLPLSGWAGAMLQPAGQDMSLLAAPAPLPDGHGTVVAKAHQASMPARERTEVGPGTAGRARAVDRLLAEDRAEGLGFDLVLDLGDVAPARLHAGPAGLGSSR